MNRGAQRRQSAILWLRAKYYFHPTITLMTYMAHFGLAMVSGDHHTTIMLNILPRHMASGYSGIDGSIKPSLAKR